MVVALLKMCRFKPVSWLINVYILIMRGTPLMLQIITIYYAIPMLKMADSPFLQNLNNPFHHLWQDYPEKCLKLGKTQSCGSFVLSSRN